MACCSVAQAEVTLQQGFEAFPVDARADAPEPGQWHQLSTSFRIGPGPDQRWGEVRQAVVALRIEWADQGQVWFDDFRCEEVASAR